MKNGINNPVLQYQKEVDILNKARETDGIKKISNNSPILSLGYFPLKNIMDKLKIKKYVDYFKLTNDFKYDLFELLSSLIYARSVNPCSKNKTFHEVLPNLYHPYHYSYDHSFTTYLRICSCHFFSSAYHSQKNSFSCIDASNTGSRNSFIR